MSMQEREESDYEEPTHIRVGLSVETCVDHLPDSREVVHGRNDRSTVSKVRQIHTIEKRQSVRVDVLHNRGLIFERGSEFGVDGDTIQVADRIRHLADTIPTRPRPRRHIHCCFPAGSRTETRDETVSEHRLDSLHEFRKGVLCHNLPAHTLKRHPATGLHRKIPHLWRETQVASHGR